MVDPVLVASMSATAAQIEALTPSLHAAGITVSGEGTLVSLTGPFDAVMAAIRTTTTGTAGDPLFALDRQATDLYALSLVYPELTLPQPSTPFAMMIGDRVMAEILAKKSVFEGVEVTFSAKGESERPQGARARLEASIQSAGLNVEIQSLRASRVKVRGFPLPLYRTNYHARVKASPKDILFLSLDQTYTVDYPEPSFFQRLLKSLTER